MKKAIETVLIVILALLCIFTAYKAYTIKDKVQYITVTDTVKICDTITNWQYDTVYFNRYDTINTTDVVIINDTVNDTTYIQLPIYTYIYDTTITDTNYKTDLRAVLSGHSVNMDSLYLSTEITRQEAILVPKQRRWGIGAGLMYGTGGFGFGVGIFYKLF